MPVAANIPGLPTNPRNGRVLLLAQIAGLAATGWLVWNQSVAPRLAWQGLAGILAKASFYVLLTWVLSAIITFWVYLIVADEEPVNLIGASLGAAAPAAWFAPAIILMSTLSPAGIFGSLALIVTASRLLVHGWLPTGFISTGQAVRWNPLPAVCSAFVLQAGMVALVWEYPMLAAASFTLSAAVIIALAVMRSGKKPERPQPLPPSTLSVVLTILLASAITTGGLRFRDYASGSGSGDAKAGTQGSNAVSATDLADPETTPFAVGSGGFPGVILRPVQVKEATVLIAPVRSLLKKGEQRTRPLTIPFTGEYWMYQPPFIRPPGTSFVRRGSPLELSFHTNNGTSMSMEARQKLPAPIGLACCRRLEIEIALRGGLDDLLLKVTLIDSQAKEILELGSSPVGPEGSQTLRYNIPAGSEQRKFDEIQIAYYRSRPHMSRSVNLAVERFGLVPRI